MRLIFILLALACAACGAIFGAFNSDAVAYDFYFTQATLPKGAALLAALVIGWLAGGALVYVARVPALRRRVRAQAKELHRLQARRDAVPPADADGTALALPARDA